MRKIKYTAVVMTLLSAAIANSAPVSTGTDEAMTALATHSGCLTCHSINRALSEGTVAKPVGPAWSDVAAKYKDQKGAVQKLTATVMQGSNPYASHWKGKVTGLAMPPNAVAIHRDEARQLVR